MNIDHERGTDVGLDPGRGKSRVHARNPVTTRRETQLLSVARYYETGLLKLLFEKTPVREQRLGVVLQNPGKNLLHLSIQERELLDEEVVTRLAVSHLVHAPKRNGEIEVALHRRGQVIERSLADDEGGAILHLLGRQPWKRRVYRVFDARRQSQGVRLELSGHSLQQTVKPRVDLGGIQRLSERQIKLLPRWGSQVADSVKPRDDRQPELVDNTAQEQPNANERQDRSGEVLRAIEEEEGSLTRGEPAIRSVTDSRESP